MTRREFERIVEEAVKSLPEAFRDRIENVVIRVAESPSKRQSRVTETKGRREPALYGLYEGVPRTDRSVEDAVRTPDRITIFKRAIERDHRSRSAMVRCIQETVLHELGHYFGLDDSQLDQLGCG
jgi:predicted Zn-dependent protease with MMP-like domain